jgi:K(+)-stimulated pyrophosphate-energized sodium pump
MNILIKLTCLIGLVIAPILGGHDASTEQDDLESIEVIIENEVLIDNTNLDISDDNQ